MEEIKFGKMDGIIFDLKNFRLKQLNGMSQEEFAKQIGISQDKVSRMEKDPSQISLGVLIEIATHFGMGLNELISLPKREKKCLEIENTWSSAQFIRDTLIDYITKCGVGGVYEKDTQELKTLVEKAIRKPKVAFIGRSDVGKSTMINTLLGAARMPAQWTPTTAIAVYIKHTDDRPSYMDEDVWIFHSDESTNESWDDGRLSDEEYCRSLKLSSGNYDLLNTYGTREGEYFAETKATAAVVFINSDLLHDCDIVDLPGYGTGDRLEDDALSLREKNKADVLVYMSIANGFMRSEDISYIKEALPLLADMDANGKNEIPPLEKLFIVASQAHVIDNGNKEELNRILAAGCERFMRSSTDEFWDKLQIYTATEDEKCKLFERRFYTYTSNYPKLCEDFEVHFRALIEKLPQVIEQKAKEIISKWAESKGELIQGVIDSYEKLLEDRKKCEEALREYDRREPKRYAAFQKTRQKIERNIKKYNSESKEEIDDFYYDTINVENLISIMERRGIKKKKEDLEIFSTYVSELLQNETDSVVRKKSEKLADDIKEFLGSFDENTKISMNISFKLSPFCIEQAFAAGLAGITTYGGLAIWAASCGNLGGYILVAKGVSLLSTLGISVGGTAAAISAVAAIGGPAVLGMAFALIAAAGAFTIFSGTWKKSVAKKFVESCRNERVLDKLQENINTYWNDTQVAFNAAADSLDVEWKKYVESLRERVRNYDEIALQKAQEEAKSMLDFLQNIPYCFED